MSSQLEMAAIGGAGNLRESDRLHLSPITTPPSRESFVIDIENDDIEAGSDFCRICMEFDEHDDELIAPCLCKGSLHHVHRCCLDHWRSVKEGFAFTNCTTCKAKFHIQVTELEEGMSRRIMKFKLFIARDTFLLCLAIQAAIATIGGCAYLMDRNGAFRSLFTYSWDPTLSNHPVPFFYSMGVMAFMLLIGIIGLFAHFIPETSTDQEQHPTGCQNCPYYSLGMLECLLSTTIEAWITLACTFLVFFTILGMVYCFFAFSILFQRICQKHYRIMLKKDLTKEFVVMDLKGNYTPPPPNPELDRRLRLLGIM